MLAQEGMQKLMTPKTEQTVLLHERLPGHNTVQLIHHPGRLCPFVVRSYHPSSGWLHRYQCGSLRKAMKFIDGVLLEQFVKEAKGG